MTSTPEAQAHRLEIQSDRRIAVTWANGKVSRHRFIWLRQQFFHPASGRPGDEAHGPLRLPDEPGALQAASCAVEDGKLVVVWAGDGARTYHNLAWLRRNAYDREQRLARKAKPVLAAEAATFPWLEWERVLADEEACSRCSPCCASAVSPGRKARPPKTGGVARLARRLGTLRARHRRGRRPPPTRPGGTLCPYRSRWRRQARPAYGRRPAPHAAGHQLYTSH